MRLLRVVGECDSRLVDACLAEALAVPVEELVFRESAQIDRFAPSYELGDVALRQVQEPLSGLRGLSCRCRLSITRSSSCIVRGRFTVLDILAALLTRIKRELVLVCAHLGLCERLEVLQNLVALLEAAIAQLSRIVLSGFLGQTVFVSSS